MKNANRQKYVIYLFFLFIFVYGCSEEKNNPIVPEFHERGEISDLKIIGSYTQANIISLFNSLNIEVPFNISYSVNVYSVSYYTVDQKGNEEIASGAMIVPQTDESISYISLLHGTETFSQAVASVSPLNSVEGMIGLLLGSMGYYTVVPDYLGFGVSNISHPYMHAESLTPCIIDFIRCSKTYADENQINLDGLFFLTGYSEGGYLSLATQKEIELNYSEEFNITAAAPMSGPYDLEGMVESSFQNQDYVSPAYVAFFLKSYNEIYGWNRLEEIFKEPYSEKVESLFNGSYRWAQIIEELPNTFNELVKEEFVLNYLEGNEKEVVDAFAENTLIDWLPQAPIHFFHGDADQIVPYENVLNAIQSFELKGKTDVWLTTIDGGTHESSGSEASLGAIAWFESFRKGI